MLSAASAPPAQSMAAPSGPPAADSGPPSRPPAAEAGEGVAGRPVTAQTASEPPKQGGLPQFRLEFWAGQIVWLVVLFALLYALLARVFVPRFRRVKDERDEAIGGAIRAARAAQAEAEAIGREADEAMRLAREHVEEILEEARARAGAESISRTRAQEAALAQKLEEAEGRIRRAHENAMASVRDVAAEAAGAIVNRLTGAAPAPGEVDAALAAEPA